MTGEKIVEVDREIVRDMTIEIVELGEGRRGIRLSHRAFFRETPVLSFSVILDLRESQSLASEMLRLVEREEQP